MRELRLSGVHEDGEHLLLVDDEGERSQLRITEELRSAIRRDRSRALADAGVPEHDQVELRPRDVQGLLRSGLSLEDVAERAGWTVEKVSRYEAPIRAERDHVAALARAVPVADPAARRGEEGTFGERVERRLDGRGVAADDVTWDSWRDSEQDWTVQCAFPAGGRLRQATWRFAVDTCILTPVDDEARWLGEDESSPGPLQAATPVRDTSVYDVEAEGGLDGAPAPKVRTVRGGASSATAVPSHPAGRAADREDTSAGTATGGVAEADTVDLMAAMRERTKGRRRKGRGRQSASASTDFPADAAPPAQVDTDGPPPPLGSHPCEEEAAASASSTSSDAATTDTTADAPDAPERPSHDPVTGTADMFADFDFDSVRRPGSRSETLAVDDIAPDDDRDAVGAEPEVVEVAEDDVPADDETADAAEQSKPETDDTSDGTTGTTIPDRPSAARKGRPSVPSWDDIMFGRRPGRD
ncbi:DUF3071 domain-containing protein [Flexivirga sp. ID2601S]|uniref:DUF3071 domain-containing protein n=1 Tax=Flexivirga aerilata TaxID=1656889 RepID=A0A849AKS2_9MICO|nr:septation protein SepH [Flexivirga aerilata]NNG39878.1 DUF3071 domain-containing protein [Flexivirga aerilata]